VADFQSERPWSSSPIRPARRGRHRPNQWRRTVILPGAAGLLLLLIPFVALLYPPFYAGLTPRLAGIPFFIWYQFLWVVIGVSITGVVYAIDRISERAP